MNTIEITNLVFNLLLPQAQKDAGADVSIEESPYRTAILNKVLPLMKADYLRLVKNPTDTAMQVYVKIRLQEFFETRRDVLSEVAQLIAQQEAREFKGSDIMINTKNALIKSKLSAGGNINIGDTTK